MRTKDLRAMSPTERVAKLKETREALMNARGVAAMGGAPRNPGEIRQLRTTIARIMTIDNEEARREA
jgi:large subunit ribosomal protein L29